MSFLLYLCMCVLLFKGAWIFLLKRSESRLRRSLYFYEEQKKAAAKQQFEFRAQKHDLLNHVNMIHALTCMKEYEELRIYTERWTLDITNTIENDEFGHPVISALLQTKQDEAERRDVQLTYRFDRWRKPVANLCPVDLVRMMANLIDNAIDSSAEHEKALRWVRIEGDMDDHAMRILVMNPGKLPKSLVKRIFEPGYSTKNRHGGIGLSIVQELAAKHGGNVQFVNKGGQITFRIEIPLGKSA